MFYNFPVLAYIDFLSFSLMSVVKFFEGGGFGAFNGQQGGGGFSAFSNTEAGTGRPPSALFTQMRK